MQNNVGRSFINAFLNNNARKNKISEKRMGKSEGEERRLFYVKNNSEGGVEKTVLC